MEEWKDIKGYDGLYQVSNLGRVKSLGNDKSRKEKILKAETTKGGYLRVNLYKKMKGKHMLIHRMVADAFIPNPENKPYIDHIDGNPFNNSIDNLRWCTHKENMNNPIAKQRIGEFMKGHSVSQELREKIRDTHRKSIYQIDKINEHIIREWPSIIDAERELGIDHRKISNCCNGKRKTAGDFIWKYA